MNITFRDKNARMKTLGVRIKHFRKTKKLTQADLATACGWGSQSRVGNYESGVREPSLEDIEKLAGALGVSMYDLVGNPSGKEAGVNNVQEDRPPYRNQKRVAPVISWVQAGKWNEAVDLYAPGLGESYEPVEDTDGPHVFWLQVVGDSMTSPSGISIPEGYLIKVDPDADPASGNLVVAKPEDTQEVTFKKLVIDSGQKYLKPLNPAYRTIPINGNCRVVGVVKEVRLKL